VVPHITNEIKDRIVRVGRQSGAEVVIAEVGGTVGDIECLPFLEAARQIHRETGPAGTLFIHVTWLPYIGATGELKSKPTQHSVKELRSIGIQPDVIVLRSDHPVADELTEKIASFCDVDQRGVVPLVTADSIYEVPLVLDAHNLDRFIAERLELQTAGGADLTDWRELVSKVKRLREDVIVGVVGKYVELQDAYISVRESMNHAAWHHDRKVRVRWIDSQTLEGDADLSALGELDGIVVPGGFGYRGVEGMVRAARFARQRGVPYLGLCLGMQVMVIEFARSVLQSDEPNSTEFNMFTRHPVIDLLPEQKDVAEKGGTMRLGVYPCQLTPDTRADRAYGQSIVFERHRHRFEFNNDYRQLLGDAGLVISGLSPDGRLVEICELRNHPWMLGTQCHPEFKSRPNRPHPLFREFVAAVVAHREARRADELLPSPEHASAREPEQASAVA
jgi:CTP synthase